MDTEIDNGAATPLVWRQETGALLRAERELRGLEIEDIAEHLKLRASFIAAVEEGRGREHMDEVYEWSHIKAIAGMLGIELKARG